MSTISKKICLVGDFGVGKTSLIRRFVDRQFSDQYLSTVGVKISRRLVELATPSASGATNVQLLIWDIEGRTKFKAIAPTYLQGASGAIIVGDVTRPETLEQLQNHVQSFFSINPKGWVIVAFNKADLTNEEKLQKIIHTYSFDQYPQILGTRVTSAKTGQAVDEIFHTLSSQLV